MKYCLTLLSCICTLMLVQAQEEVTRSIKFQTETNKATLDMTSEQIKKNEAGEYFIVTSIGQNANVRRGLVINDDTLKYEQIPELAEDTIGSESVTYLMKLSPRLEIEKVVQLRGIYDSDLAISNDRIFAAANLFTPYQYVDDKPAIVEGATRCQIHAFDHDLNYLGVELALEQEVAKIEAVGDSSLYVSVILDGIDTIIYGMDTLYNFIEPTIAQHDTPAMINYNYKLDTMIEMWKFGSPWRDQVHNLHVDDEANMYVGGAFNSGIYSLDGESIINNGSGFTQYIMKFSPEGEIIWSFVSPIDNSSELTNFHLLDDKSILAFYRWDSSRSMNIDGIDRYANDYDPMNPGSGNSMSASVKYNIEGKIEWVYFLDGENISHSWISGVEELGDTLLVLQRVSSADSVSIGGQVYSDFNVSQAFLKLDRYSGELLDGDFIEGDNTVEFNWHRCNYIEHSKETDRIIAVFYIRNAPIEFYGQWWGEEELAGDESANLQYLIVLNGELLSSIIETAAEDLFSIYPNPVAKNGKISIKVSEEVLSRECSVQVYTATGTQVISIPVSDQISTVDLSGYPPGTYAIRISSGGRYQTRLFFIQE